MQDFISPDCAQELQAQPCNPRMAENCVGNIAGPGRGFEARQVECNMFTSTKQHSQQPLAAPPALHA